MLFHILLFIGSGLLLFWASDLIVRGIVRIASYLRWSEFVIAFFVMAMGASIPNIFVGVSAAFHGVADLAFGQVIGNSVVDLTLVAAVGVFFGGGMAVKGKIAERSAIIMMIAAILPIFLLLDGSLGRGDGLVLLLSFGVYSWWLWSKRKEHTETYEGAPLEKSPVRKFTMFVRSILGIVLGLALLLISSEGVVRTSIFFADKFNLSYVVIGVLIVGIGSALPELYFTIASARKRQNWVVLGELMGSVILLATLVLGVIAVIRPIVIDDFSPFAITRVFLVLSAGFFYLFVRTDKKITYREGIFLLILFFLFIGAELMDYVK